MVLMITNGRADVLAPTKRTSRVIDRFPQYRLIRFRNHSWRSRILGQLSIGGAFRFDILEPNLQRPR